MIYRVREYLNKLKRKQLMSYMWSKDFRVVEDELYHRFEHKNHDTYYSEFMPEYHAAFIAVQSVFEHIDRASTHTKDILHVTCKEFLFDLNNGGFFNEWRYGNFIGAFYKHDDLFRSRLILLLNLMRSHHQYARSVIRVFNHNASLSSNITYDICNYDLEWFDERIECYVTPNKNSHSE